MSDEDVESLVAYLNTLPPVNHRVPRSRIDFPVSVLIRTEPRPVRHVPPPDRRNTVAYGRYLATMASCVECHTKAEKGQPVPGMAFAGGNVFRFPGTTVVTANITPDPETGLGTWSEQEFLNRFYQYRDYVRLGPPSVGPEGFTLMPWLNFSQLAPEDLKAIYAYLRTVKPVYNPVDTHPLTPAISAVLPIR
jgi:mono/diheme cytochrome c family protein